MEPAHPGAPDPIDGDRLGRVERAVLLSVANHTVNFYARHGFLTTDDLAFRAHPNGWNSPVLAGLSNRQRWAKRSEVYTDFLIARNATYQDRSAKASFSRALHRLVDGGYLMALALAWIECCNVPGVLKEMVVQYQGQNDSYDVDSGKSTRKGPLYRLLQLTPKGWRTVELSIRQRKPSTPPVGSEGSPLPV